MYNGKGRFDPVYSEICDSIAAAAAEKSALLKARPLAVGVSSLLAGMFIAFGSIVYLAAGGALTAAGCTAVKFFSCLVFSAALSLVIMAGCELFTGSNLTMGMGVLCRRISLPAALGFWAVCWLGNFIGSWLTVAVYCLSGLAGAQATADFTACCAGAKLAASPLSMFCKGVLCNICVCLAVWCAAKLKSESGKLIMVVWCILIFMLAGFEHSVANMSILGLALINGTPGVTLGGYAANLLFVTLGNLAGGFGCVALPYWYLARPAAR